MEELGCEEEEVLGREMGMGAEGLIRKRKQRLFEGCYRREHSFTIGFQWYQSSKSRSGRHPAFISNEEIISTCTGHRITK